jgi:hypothetical protein
MKKTEKQFGIYLSKFFRNEISRYTFFAIGEKEVISMRRHLLTTPYKVHKYKVQVPQLIFLVSKKEAFLEK